MKSSLSHLVLLVLLITSCTSIKVQKTNNTYTSPIGQAVPKDYQFKNQDTLTVLSWNVEHFVDEFDNPYINNKREDNPRDVKKRTKLLAEAIKKVNADIVILQEFESAPFLSAIRDEYFPNMGYQFVADAESDNWYMNVVVMSKVPLGVIYSYGQVNTMAQYTDDKGEKQYETQSMINTRMWSIDVQATKDYSFILSGVHLKAGRGARNIAMRKGQIQFLKGQYDRFLNENSNTGVLLVGDFNCTPDSEEFNYLLDGGFKTQFKDPLPASVLSHPADNPKWRIDHVLPNQNMSPKLTSVNIPYLFDKKTQRELSDHLPVIAKVTLK